MTSNEQVKVTAALSVARILWPDFIQEHGCVFLGWHSGSNPPPTNDTATGWESFVNHTHIFDEFANDASTFASDEFANDASTHFLVYDERHSDFLAACELAKRSRSCGP